jgi:phenylacetate-CoA ligase
LQWNYAFFARFLTWAGVPRGARVATFAGRTVVRPDQSEPPYWRLNLAGRALLLSSYHLAPTTIDDYVERLRAFQPEVIDAYPSSIEPIARRLRELGTPTIRPRAVVTSSETLFPAVRETIEKAFGCQVFDYYGAAEMAALVTQCERGTYHVNPEFGIVEILRDGEPARPGDEGEIVATGFINPLMPLIRYRTGDLAVAGDGGCACGRSFPTLGRIVGRLDDIIVTPGGRRVGRLDPIFKAVTSLAETRIVQDADDHVTVEVVLGDVLPELERVTLLRELANRLGPAMRIDLVAVPHIPRSASGKLRTVVNLASAERDPHPAVPT